MHTTQGASVWKMYREFEESQGKEEEEGGPVADDGDLDEHGERTRSLFLRQLGLPLQGNDRIMSAFMNWSRQKGRLHREHIPSYCIYFCIYTYSSTQQGIHG